MYSDDCPLAKWHVLLSLISLAGGGQSLLGRIKPILDILPVTYQPPISNARFLEHSEVGV